MRNVLLCLLTFLFVATTLAQTPQQHYEVTVTTIDVWAKVTDKSGKPIEGLTQADFQIFEDDQPVQSTCFEEVKLHIGPVASNNARRSRRGNARNTGQKICYLSRSF